MFPFFFHAFNETKDITAHSKHRPMTLAFFRGIDVSQFFEQGPPAAGSHIGLKVKTASLSTIALVIIIVVATLTLFFIAAYMVIGKHVPSRLTFPKKLPLVLSPSRVAAQLARSFDQLYPESPSTSSKKFEPDTDIEESSSDNARFTTSKMLAQYAHFRALDASGDTRLWFWVPEAMSQDHDMFMKTSLEPFDGDLIPVPFAKYEWSALVLEKCLLASQVTSTVWPDGRFDSLLQAVQEEKLQLVKVDNKMIGIRDSVAIRVFCPEKQKLMVVTGDPREHFPESPRHFEIDPWTCAHTLMTTRFHLPTTSFQIDPTEDIIEEMEDSPYPDLNIFVRRHVIDVHLEPTEKHENPQDLDNVLAGIGLPDTSEFSIGRDTYEWRSIDLCEGLQGRKTARLIFDDAKQHHAWTPESVADFLRRYYVDVDSLSKDPKSHLSLVKELNEGKLFLMLTKRGELVLVQRTIFVKLYSPDKDDICVGANNKERITFPHMSFCKESIDTAARKCITTKLRYSHDIFLYERQRGQSQGHFQEAPKPKPKLRRSRFSATDLDQAVQPVHPLSTPASPFTVTQVAQGIYTHTLYPMRTLCENYVVDATIVSKDPRILKSLGLKFSKGGASSSHDSLARPEFSPKKSTRDTIALRKLSALGALGSLGKKGSGTPSGKNPMLLFKK